jgi:hypothetical protein
MAALDRAMALRRDDGSARRRTGGCAERPAFWHARDRGSRIPRLEVGFSRTAQWCGDGRPCDIDTFWDLLIGNDNDQPTAEQPGNQLGGFDVRWSLPWAPVALYAQAIGEDEANFMPSKYLGLAGIEFWGGFGERSWRAHIEAADTACSFTSSPPDFGCAYRNSIYFDGYQYYDRAIGHSIDGDSRQIAAGLMLVNGDGSSWELALQDAAVNRRGANRSSRYPGPEEIASVDLHHRRALFGVTCGSASAMKSATPMVRASTKKTSGIPAMVGNGSDDSAKDWQPGWGRTLIAFALLTLPAAAQQAPTQAQINAFKSLPPAAAAGASEADTASAARCRRAGCRAAADGADAAAQGGNGVDVNGLPLPSRALLVEVAPRLRAGEHC